MVITSDGFVITYEEFLDLVRSERWFLKRLSLRKLRLFLFSSRKKQIPLWGDNMDFILAFLFAVFGAKIICAILDS